MSRNLARILYFATLIVGLIVYVILLVNRRMMLANLVVVAILVGITYCSYHLRCPGCSRWPGKHTLFAHYCPRCGEPLD